MIMKKINLNTEFKLLFPHKEFHEESFYTEFKKKYPSNIRIIQMIHL